MRARPFVRAAFIDAERAMLGWLVHREPAALFFGLGLDSAHAHLKLPSFQLGYRLGAAIEGHWGNE